MKRKNGEPRTVEWQEWMLAQMVREEFVKKTQQVKGPYTSGDYVTFLLNEIFGPSHWSHRILDGPKMVQYGEAMAYCQATIQLTVRFADGTESIHEDIGIWTFYATDARGGGTLDESKPERWEQVVKSTITDGLKACTDHLGNCFRPIADKELEGFLRRRQAAENLKDKGKSSVGEPAEKARKDLFGKEYEKEPAPKAEEPGPVSPPAAEAEGVSAAAETKAEDIPAADEQRHTEYPKTITELYARAENEKGINSKDAAALIQEKLDEKYPDGIDIGGYVKLYKADALDNMWDWLTDALESG